MRHRWFRTSALLILLFLLGADWIPQGGFYIVSSLGPGNTNTSNAGTGADVAHTLTYDFTCPPCLRAGQVIRACSTWAITTGASVPTLLLKLKAGGTTLVAPTASTVPTNVTGRNIHLCYQTVVRAAPGASVSTDSSLLSFPEATAATVNSNSVVQPVTLNTLGTLTWGMTSQWTSTVGANTVTLLSLVIETTKP